MVRQSPDSPMPARPLKYLTNFLLEDFGDFSETFRSAVYFISPVRHLGEGFSNVYHMNKGRRTLASDAFQHIVERVYEQTSA